jgi:antitoxin (DNA-binding transcriptional repressor) of toxin-antitoxin stability system
MMLVLIAAESVIGGRHHLGMAQPDVRPQLELSLIEARTRFVQIVRAASLVGQRTVVMDGGRPVAVLAPIDSLSRRDDHEQGNTAGPGAAAAGWIRRIEQVRADAHRQHADLQRALSQVWRLLDEVKPRGTDEAVDALRSAHLDLRRLD